MDGKIYVGSGELRSYKVEVTADSSGEWCGNDLRFKTREEAEVYAKDLFCRWTAIKGWRVVESNDPVNESMPVR